MNQKASIVTLFLLVIVCLLLGKTTAAALSDESDCFADGTSCSPWEGNVCCGDCLRSEGGKWACAGNSF